MEECQSSPTKEEVKSPEKFLGTIHIGDRGFAVMSSTESILDGKPVPYLKIPDEDTELIEITIDMERRVIKKVVYRTVKDA